jgi:3-aminobutyryl-CoA ammonia-lyase
MISFRLIVRIGIEDAHYSNGLVAGSHIMMLFGDAATVLMQKHDGDGGLLAGYESVKFIEPVYVGDVLEIEAVIKKIGNTSRTIQFSAWKILQQKDVGPYSSSAKVLEPPVIVCSAVGTSVVKKEKQWLTKK